jgi:hypothetical protein
MTRNSKVNNWNVRNSNFKSCIYNAKSLPTELSSHGRSDSSSNTPFFIYNITFIYSF